MRICEIRVVRVRKGICGTAPNPLGLRVFVLGLLTLLLASCAGPAPAPVTPSAPPAATVIPRAPEIRFALVGQPSDVNVWALFDESGASYANYALRSDEYPRLYRLSVPEREFEPYTAAGRPSIVTQEGGFYVATVQLQPGLKWSDGSSFSAQDAAFTINTALAFHLRLDWLSAYNPALLDHADAVDDAMIKFFFKGPFNVGNWQYGALQGPIVNQAHWSSKVTGAAALLPSRELVASLEEGKAEAATLQARIDADNAQLLTSLPDTATYNELSARVTRNQDELNSVNSRLAQLQDEYDAALNAARAALFALPDEAEPTFGPFLRATQNGNTYTRIANPKFPFEKPKFDRAVYEIFADVESAVAALEAGQVNISLSAMGIPQQLTFERIEDNPDLSWMGNSSTSARFIAINPSRPALADSDFRRAIFCAASAIPRLIMTGMLPQSFVTTANEYWQYPNAGNLCQELGTESQRIAEFLKTKGFSWVKEPGEGAEGFTLPDGTLFPPVSLLVPFDETDPARAEAAREFEIIAYQLGIPLTVKLVSAEDFRYAVYSSGEYDMAIVGYRVSAYPGYLCDWFQAPSPFEYGSDRLRSACEAFNSTADLETARQASFRIQSILLEDLPLIPLYEVLRHDAYRNISYPFYSVLDGLSGLYGAPSLAVPAP